MDDGRRAPWPGGWDVLMVAGMTLLALVYAWIQPWLPDPVPTHFDALGRTNGWTDKAHLPWVVFGLPLGFWCVLWGIGWISARAARKPGQDASAAFVPLRGFLGLGMALLMVGCLMVPFRGPLAIHAGAAGFFLCLVLGIVFMARELKRLLAGQPDAGHYRWGCFYVNPEDPRLWVEKRLGLGWTLNYAHPSAWWVTILLLLPVAALVALMGVMKK